MWNRNSLWRTWIKARQKQAEPQHCDQCSSLIGEKLYLVCTTRFLFWTQETSRLCPQCYEQYIAQLRQTGVIPPHA